MMDKFQIVQDKLADLNDEFKEDSVTREEFKRLLREWVQLVVGEMNLPMDKSPISLFDYIRVRCGKF